MPRVNRLIKKDPREVELLQRIGAAQAATGLSCKEICRRAGLQYETFRLHYRNPGQMRRFEEWAFLDTCERLTG